MSRCAAWHERPSKYLTVRVEYAWECAEEAVPGGKFCKAHGGTSQCCATPKGE